MIPPELPARAVFAAKTACLWTTRVASSRGATTMDRCFVPRSKARNPGKKKALLCRNARATYAVTAFRRSFVWARIPCIVAKTAGTAGEDSCVSGRQVGLSGRNQPQDCGRFSAKSLLSRGAFLDDYICGHLPHQGAVNETRKRRLKALLEGVAAFLRWLGRRITPCRRVTASFC